MKLLENKVVIVTGAARGIGEGVALKLAEHGAHIAFSYVSESSAEKATTLEKKLVDLGVKAKAYRSNAGDQEDEFVENSRRCGNAGLGQRACCFASTCVE